METLKDHTRVLTLSKQLENCADRIIATLRREGPPLIRKAVVPAIVPGDVTFIADPDSQPLLHQVQRRSTPGRLLQLGSVEVPPGRLLPTVPDDPSPTWVGEGAAVPLARLTSTNRSTGSYYYILMLAFLLELLKPGDARARNLILSRSIRALSKADNTVFLSALAATSAQSAGILWNRSAIGGGSPANLGDDVEELVAVVVDGEAYAPVFIVSPRGAAFLNASGVNAFRDVGVLGGTIAGAPAIVTPAAGNNLILVDASEIAISDDGVEVRLSENAAIEMLDNPTNNSATATPTQMVSGFQTNAAVLRLVRYLSWTLLRDDAVGFIELPIGGSPS